MPTSPTDYLKLFFERGKIVFNHATNIEENKRMFRSVLIQLHVDHPKFVTECTSENILKIDDKNLIIELVM